ncbi:mas-related G-protein coupled receptor member X2-like [Urocitellus parryii]
MDPTIPALWSEITTMNGSDPAVPPQCGKEKLILRLLTFIIASVGLAGNAVVIWLLGFCIRRNVFSIYILNLAGADFFFLCCHLIGSLVTFINFFHSNSVAIPEFLNTVMIFYYIAGVSMLSSISTERCLSILCPIWYRFHRPRHMSTIMCAVLWALSLLLSILEGVYCGFLLRDSDTDRCQAFDFICVAWLIILVVILLGSSLVLLVRILCSSRPMLLTRLYVTILITALVFFLLAVPLGIFWFLLYWFYNDINSLPCRFLLVALVMSCVNSSANPIIYFFVGSFRQRQRQSLKLILQRALKDTPTADLMILHPLINIFHFMLTQMFKFFIIIGIFAYIASLSMLSAISIERCLSVLFPIWHHCRCPRHTSTIMCALLWALTLLLSFLDGSHCGFLLMEMNVALCQTSEFILSTWLLVLFVVLFGSSLALLVRILCGSRRKFVTRLYMTTGLTVLAFLLGDLPFGLQNLLISLFHIDLDISSGYAFVVSYTLSSINRCTNPIIYFFVGSFRHQFQGRQNLKLILQRALQDTPEDDQCVDPPSRQALQMSGRTVGH